MTHTGDIQDVRHILDHSKDPVAQNFTLKPTHPQPKKIDIIEERNGWRIERDSSTAIRALYLLYIILRYPGRDLIILSFYW